MAHNPPLAQPGAAAPNHRRNRNPRSPIPGAPSVAVTGTSPLLEVASAFPMRTIHRHSPNLFIPDSQMMFHMLSICDQMMNNTKDFLKYSPAWIPIVSQLYISVLWVVHILRVSVKSGYGGFNYSFLDDIVRCLGVDECMIPGPLVPFFQSIAAVNGPFDWIGDILPRFPSFNEFWDNTTRSPSHNYARQIPFPALMLDQLARFGASVPESGQNSNYTTFQWYSNIFNIDFKDAENLYFVGPQTCGSLYVTQSQHDNARSFWGIALDGFTRLDLRANQPGLTNFNQVFGFATQNGSGQIPWFQQVANVMEKYTRYFTYSVPLKSIVTAGIGSTAIHGRPQESATVSQWMYPPDNQINPFTSARFKPLRPIPAKLHVTFTRSDHESEEEAERYAIVSHTNINWSDIGIGNANSKFISIEEKSLYKGEYWNMLPHRTSDPVLIYAHHFVRVVVSKYHIDYL